MNTATILMMPDDVLDDVVKIQGTRYDRKRKVTPEMALEMMEMRNAGYGVEVIAYEFGVSTTAVKYNTDQEFRKKHLSGCTGLHTGKDRISIGDRVEYKRRLVAQGCLSI